MKRLTDTSHNDRIATIAAAIAKYEADTRPARVSSAGTGENPWKLAGRPKGASWRVP
jgi:hypothetical protein